MAGKSENLFERFQIDSTKRFGEGGYGATFAAKDTKTKELCVVKVVDIRKMKLELIQQECQFMETCRGHDNVIQLRGHGLGHGKHGHLYFIFMEMASGGELFDVLTTHNGPVPELKVRNYMVQLFHATQHCHSKGVAHRDLKLENVLLNSAGLVKLIDFGLSHQYGFDKHGNVDRSKPIQGYCGSKSYAAPEVLQGQGYDGYVADMWSLGVCAFGLLNGFFPLDEAKSSDWRFAKLQDAQARGKSSTTTIMAWYKKKPHHLSPYICDLLDRLLLIDPSKRLSMEEALKHPWLDTKFDPTAVEETVKYRSGYDVDHLGADVTMEDMEILDESPVYRSLGGMPDPDEEEVPAAAPVMMRQAAFNDSLASAFISELAL